MKFREQRGTLEDSLKTVVEIDPSKRAIAAFLAAIHECPIAVDEIEVVSYARDTRIHWDTHLVLWNGRAVGFTDGPLS